VDRDVVELQKGISEQVCAFFRNALCYYVAGEWPEAKEQLDKALEIVTDDGPTNAMIRFLEYHQFVPPEDWSGCRPRADVTAEHMHDPAEVSALAITARASSPKSP